MGKRIIRLTEADIENIVKKVIQEQGRGDLTGVRGRRNNDSYGPPSWRGRKKGQVDFDAISDTSIIATNVARNKYTLRYINDLNLVGQPIVPEGGEDVTIEDVVIKGTGLPYPDNMVLPYFEDYPEAKNNFEKIVKQFVKYVNLGGAKNLKNVTIQGSADSAAPTLKVPSGFSKLDHPHSQPYNGEKDPFKMNQYLADTRASEYAKVLINEVKKATGFDLKIKVLPGENYYGQEGKRGEEFRKIVIKPNATPISDNQSSRSGNTQARRGEKTAQPYKLQYTVGAERKVVNGYRLVDENGKVFYGVTGEVYDSLNPKPPFFDGKMDSTFNGQNLIISGMNMGKFNEGDELPVRVTNFGERIKGWIGPVTSVFGTREHIYNIEGERKSIIYLANRYFTFY